MGSIASFMNGRALAAPSTALLRSVRTNRLLGVAGVFSVLLSLTGCGGSEGSPGASSKGRASAAREDAGTKADMSWLEHAVHLPLPSRDPKLIVKHVSDLQRGVPYDLEILDPRTGFACRRTAGNWEDKKYYYTFVNDGEWHKIYNIRYYTIHESGHEKIIYRIFSIIARNGGEIDSLSRDRTDGPEITIDDLLTCLSAQPLTAVGGIQKVVDVYYAPIMAGERL